MSSVTSNDAGSEGAPQRVRLNLKPRDENAAKQAELERQQKLKNNPFGAAKPREAILAERTGKSENEILKEAVKGEKIKVRLTPQQLEEKKALEAAVQEIQDQLDQEEDAANREALEAELQKRQGDVDALMSKFEELFIEAAKAGALPRPSERKAEAPPPALDSGNPRGGAGSYSRSGSGGYGPPREGGRGFSNYNDRSSRGGYNQGGEESRGYDNGRAGGYDQPRPRGFTNYNPPKTGSFEEGSGNGSFKNFGGDRRPQRSGSGFDDDRRPGFPGYSDEKRGGGFSNYDDDRKGGFPSYDDDRGGRGYSGRGGRSGPASDLVDSSGFGNGFGTGGGDGGYRSGGGGGRGRYGDPRGGGYGGGRGRGGHRVDNDDDPSNYPGMGGSSSVGYVDYVSPYSQDRY